MESIGGENKGLPTSIRQVVTASFIGTAIEWYDYFILEVLAIPLFGALSDPVGRKPLLIGGALFLGIWTFPSFALLNKESTVLIVLATVAGLSIGHACVYGTQAAFYAELFGTRVRYTAASFGYHIAGIFGALAPIIAATLFPVGGPTFIAVYVATVCFLSVICYALANEAYRKDIYAEDPEERKLIAEQRG